MRCVSPADRALKDHLMKLTMNGFVSSSEIETRHRMGLGALCVEAARRRVRSNEPCELDPLHGDLVDRLGNVDEVRNVMDDYRARTREWVSYEARLPLNGGSDWYEIRGEELRPSDPMSTSTLGMLEAFDEDEGEPAKRRTVRRAREELWQHLGKATWRRAGSIRVGGWHRYRRVSGATLSWPADRKVAHFLVFAPEHGRSLRQHHNPKSTNPRPLAGAGTGSGGGARGRRRANPSEKEPRKLFATLQAIAALNADGGLTG